MSRCRALLCAGVLWGLLPHASGQTTAQPYEDRLIDGGNLPPQVSAGSNDATHADGWPRSIAVTVQAGATQTGSAERNSYLGAIASGQIDTPNHGAYSFELNARQRPGSVFGVIEQRRMPLDGGWFSSAALGITNTTSPGLQSQQSGRFVLPTSPIQGLAARLTQPARGLDLAASTGAQARFNADGTALGIERTDGNISTVGGQWASARWLAGANVIASRDTTEAGIALKRADALHSYVGWRSGDLQAQAQVVQSKTSASGQATGLWADMQTRTGPIQHEWGVFRFEPGVAWGPLAMVSDLQGAHYRASYRARQLIWDANAEVFKPLSGPSATGQYFALNSRYQVSRDLGVGGSAAVRRQGQNATAVSAFVDAINTLGNTRVQWDRQEDLSAQTTDRIVLDQAWAIPAGWRASTSLGFESIRGGTNNRALIAGALLGADPRPDLTVDLNLRTRRALDTAGENSFDASLSARLQLNANWLVSLSYSASRGEFTQFPTLDPLVISPAVTTSTSNKSLLVALRYQDQAGRAVAPLGGRPGDAAGSIRGVVYLDANDNGKRDAGEAAAANITVVLDGRFAVRTDAQGWFEFPMVTAGNHKLTAVQDNLPLPWFAPESAINAEVSTRSVTQIDIGAKRGN